MTKKLVCGVGLNDAAYVTQKFETIGRVDGKLEQRRVWVCPYYSAWVNMLNRCYSTKLHGRSPTYVGCSVSDDWLTFSNFRSWMTTQDWQGNQLDKDLLFVGNKVYGPKTCVFVTPVVNTFAVDRTAARGKWLIGVSWYKRDGKFVSHCNNPFTNKREHLGYFTYEQVAHQAWLKRKLELAKELAAIQTDARVAAALIKRYSNYKIN